MANELRSKTKYEVFAREVGFDEIEGIKRVFQPGSLSLQYFFEPTALNRAVSELCGYSAQPIQVYFNDFEDINISSGIQKSRKADLKWWRCFQSFAPLVADFPAGVELEYWYGPEKKAHSLPVFNEQKPPYQAFVRLFNGAINGFSCFVNQNPCQVEFSSWYTNYGNLKPGEGLVHNRESLWVGDSETLKRSGAVLANALGEMKRIGYQIGVENMAGMRRREMRIIFPERGAIISSLMGGHSIDLLIKNSSIEELVNRYHKPERRIAVA